MRSEYIYDAVSWQRDTLTAKLAPERQYLREAVDVVHLAAVRGEREAGHTDIVAPKSYVPPPERWVVAPIGYVPPPPRYVNSCKAQIGQKPKETTPRIWNQEE